MSKKRAKEFCEEQKIFTERSGARFEPQAAQGIIFRYNERGLPFVCVIWKRDQHNKILLNSTMTHMYVAHDGTTYTLSLGPMVSVEDDISTHTLRGVESDGPNGS